MESSKGTGYPVEALVYLAISNLDSAKKRSQFALFSLLRSRVCGGVARTQHNQQATRQATRRVAPWPAAGTCARGPASRVWRMCCSLSALRHRPRVRLVLVSGRIASRGVATIVDPAGATAERCVGHTCTLCIMAGARPANRGRSCAQTELRPGLSPTGTTGTGV